ncbi:SDR family NAD(P)-dependent oxidoreductase [Rhodococcus aetherivorans]|uniref:SDR family NAD(P)-dependent oxidoreductase n=1 Tax=Rhodococcus aetherivorans TaxID=191292 RepID=UPI00163AFA6C|nr:glucose 1-dehydrogenase [Rhodococcus aetherivorans]MBC2592369.1 glucose 1-dehydrogenase [Rhodococcus aetherivorans]
MGILDGKVAVITGGASGQGAAEARLFTAEGAKVVIADIQDDLGKNLVDELAGAAIYVHTDVSNEDDWHETIRQTIDAFGDPTILVQNAAIVHHKLIEDSTRAEFDRVLAVNLVGPYLGMRAVLEPMQRAGGGSIINVGSGSALNGTGGRALYGSSKWGLRGLTKSAAIEFGVFGIRVNSLQPGAIDTPMLRRSDQEIPPPRIPIPRYGQPEELAQAALFLASDHGAYVTGIDLPVDGGSTAGSWAVPRETFKTDA